MVILGGMQTFIDPDLLDRLRVGPLASYLDTYLKRIEQEGFLPSSVPMQMYAIARFSNWLHTGQVDLHQVDEATVERFLHRDLDIVHSAESAPLRRFLAMLREIGVTAAKPPEPRSCRQRFVDEYRRYLLRERGLAETSLLNYVPFAEQLLSSRFGQSDTNLSELTAMDVTKFITGAACALRARLLPSASSGELAVACGSSAEHSGQIHRNAKCSSDGVDPRGATQEEVGLISTTKVPDRDDVHIDYWTSVRPAPNCNLRSLYF